MKKIILLAAIALSACTTPDTVLKNEKTGQIQRCGGVTVYAGILYFPQKNSDEKCVEEYQSQGFKRINPNTDQANN